MRAIPSLLLTCAVAAHALADMTTITDRITITPSATDSAIQATSTAVQPTLATTTWSSTAAAVTAASTGYSDSDGSDGSSSNAVDSDAGASGSGSSFSISKGGLIAIIVVVVIVALFGIASTILFVVAKRRQWNIRASIARASRRLTGRSGVPATPRSARHNNRRTTMQAGRMDSPAGGPRSARTPGHKRGIVVDERDVEKGPLAGKGPTNTRGKEGGWAQRLWGNDWK